MNIELLKEPFSACDIEWRVGATTKDKTKGIALGYVTNRAIQNRLDEVCGKFGWKNEFKEWHGNSQLCGISIFDKESKTWITKWDGASNTEVVKKTGDGKYVLDEDTNTKGGLSNSMKRAGYQWDIGRYLYKLPVLWVAIKKRGSSYVLDAIPKIPAEFLPKSKQPKPLTNEQVLILEDRIVLSNANKSDILKYYNVATIDKIPANSFDQIVKNLNKKIK